MTPCGLRRDEVAVVDRRRSSADGKVWSLLPRAATGVTPCLRAYFIARATAATNARWAGSLLAFELGRLLEGVVVDEEAHVDDVELRVAGIGEAVDDVTGVAGQVGRADLDRDERDVRGDADDAEAVGWAADRAGDVRAVELVVEHGGGCRPPGWLACCRR